MKKIKFSIVFVFMIILFVISPLYDSSHFIVSHSSIAYPTEIFSLWNNTIPTIDGTISFASGDISKEWSSAAVYNLYTNTNGLGGKLLLQNNDANLFIGMDIINFQVDDPITSWGSSIYFDVDHNGILSPSDRLVRFTDNSSGQYVEFLSYSDSSMVWLLIEDGSLGISLTSGILFSSSFQISEFEDVNAHRQYEIKIPFSAISSSAGDALGIGFEATDNYPSQNAGITWPYIGTNQDVIRTNAAKWGDIHLEKNTFDSFQFVVEKNLNIKSSAVGYNNGTFLTTGDIDGNGDLELIVSSNRTVFGDRNLIAIFDYRSGSYQRIWSSWTTSHQVKITTVMSGIAAYDFTGDGYDEIYCIGTSNDILRFSGWNTTINDFKISETIFTHSNAFMGYLSISDGNNDSIPNLNAGDQNGKVVVLVYDSLTDSFDHDKRSPFTPVIDGSNAFRIHAIVAGDMDNDLESELLFFSQTSSNNTISPTSLQIYLKTVAKFLDNPDDDLPQDSTTTTADYFGHSIIVDDVDNDNLNETIIVGKDYLRIFEYNTFSDPSPSLEFLLNDPSSQPSIIGGAAVGDVDLDGTNELVFSSNNGSIFIGQVSDTGSLQFTLNWSGDFGSSFGKRSSIMIFDIDNDGRNEIVLGDQFGQILILGQGKIPEISINSPSSGFISSQESVLVDWDTTSEFIALHHMDVFVNGLFKKRIGGSQKSTEVFLTPGQNNIKLTIYSMSSLTFSTNVTVKFDVKAPQVTITSPENNYLTNLDTVSISYTNTDPDDDFDYYKIYRNGSLLESNVIDETYDVDLPSDGKWNITVVAVDEIPLEGQSSIYVIKDTTAPIVSITSPLDGANVKVSEVDLSWDSYDLTTDVDYYEIYLDGIYQDSTMINSYTIALSVDKTYLIEVYSYDLLSNFALDSISITCDTVNPIVSFDPILLPQLPDSTYYTNNQFLTVLWNATDNILGSGISHSQITINGLLYGTYVPSIITDILDLVTDNYKEIEITTFDKAGNSANDVFGVKLDRTSPNIEISIPSDNYVTGSDYVLVSWDAFDVGTGLKEYRVYIDGLLETIISDIDTTTYLINIPENKTYTVTIRAYDLLDQYNESTVKIIHDSTYPTVVITSPTKLNSYSNDSIVYFTWEAVNLDIDHFDVYINNTFYNSYSNKTFDVYIDFGFFAIDEFPIYNITILGVLSNETSFLDLRWIKFDKSPPQISFIFPNNNDIIINSNLHVEWFSQDDGSELDFFRVEIGEITVIKDAIPAFSSIINVEGLNGIYELTIFGYDIAGNVGNISINIEISLYAPIFTTSLELIEYRNSGDFQFELSIDDPSLGVRNIVIFADNTNEIYLEDFGIDYIITPIDRIIVVEEIDFLSGSGSHNLSISVFDKVNREQRLVIEIILDKEIPLLFQQPIFDSIVLGSTILKIELSEELGLNNHSLSVFVRDNYGISGVNVTLSGDNYNQTFQMNYKEERSLITLGEFDYTFNLDDFETGDYQITLTLMDIAGNLNYISYNLQLMEIYADIPNNLGLIIALIAATVILLSAILIVALSKPIKNIGWQDEIVNISYILRSGLTVLYIPYSKEMETDEQLFGGAMSGIRGILEELIGGQTKYTVENVEFGNKNLLIYTSTYGDSVLVVKKIKPVHSKKLEHFANEFEFIYREAVSDHTQVNISRFKGAIDVVEKYFGTLDISKGIISQITKPIRRKEKRIAKAMKDISVTEKEMLIKSLHHKLSLDNASLEHISQQTKVHIGDAIILAEKALTSLISYECDQAEKYAKTALKSLELARQSGENLAIFHNVLNAIPKIVEEVFAGSKCGDENDTEGLYHAIENISKFYLEYIEKFSI